MKEQAAAVKAKYRVLIVDDHPIVRYGISQLVNREPDLMSCGEIDDGSKALTAIGNAKPDAVVIELALRNGSGLSLIRNLNVHYPNLPILVLTVREESLYAERTMRTGAKGYLMKKEGTEQVLAAIRRVLAGQWYLSEEMQSRLFHASGKRGENVAASPLERLSDRELEVFELLGQGSGTKQIASQLHVSVSTVESHRARIKDKLGLRNATELLRHAVKWAETESRD